MYTIDVNASRPYRVLIGTFLLEKTGEIAREVNRGARALIITDDNVGPLYAAPVSESLEGGGVPLRRRDLPSRRGA